MSIATLNSTNIFFNSIERIEQFYLLNEAYKQFNDPDFDAKLFLNESGRP